MYHHEISAQMFNLANSLKPGFLGTKYFYYDQLAIKFMPVLVIYFFRLNMTHMLGGGGGN